MVKRVESNKLGLVNEVASNLDILWFATADTLYNISKLRMGQILTIIDASISDPEQRKGLKDVIQQMLNNKEYFSEDLEGFFGDFGRAERLPHNRGGVEFANTSINYKLKLKTE